MSWSVSRSGKKDVIRPLVEADFDREAQRYAGTSEEKDVLGCKAAALAAIDEFEPQEGEASWQCNALKVSANGSRSKGYVHLQCDVQGFRLDS